MIIVMLFLFCGRSVYGAVIFNEISWMGTNVSSSDEWIELYNNGNSSINLEGWSISAEDGQPEILLSGEISSEGYMLLERSDDETVPGITADIIYSGALGNTGEYLELEDNSGSIQDTLNARDGWPAGDNTTKETMQWTGSVWITEAQTPKAQNNGIDTLSEEEVEEIVEQEDTEEDMPGSGSTPYTPPEFRPRLQVDGGEDIVTVVGAETQLRSRAIDWEGKEVDYERVRFVWNFGDGTFGDGRNVNHHYAYPGTYIARVELFSGHDIVSDNVSIEVRKSPLAISEVLVGDQGWVELYNNSDVILDIGRWMLQNNNSSFLFPTGTIIAPFARPVLANRQSKIIFEKDKNLELILPSGKIIDTFSLATFAEDISTVREAETFYTGSPSPGEKNEVVSSALFVSPASVSAPKVIQPVVSEKVLPIASEVIVEEQKESQDNETRKGQATVLDAEKIENRPLVWFIGSFLFAAAIGFLALFLRQKYYKV